METTPGSLLAWGLAQMQQMLRVKDTVRLQESGEAHDGT